VLSIYEDKTGILWMTTDAGFSRFDPNNDTFVNYQHDENDPNSLSENDIYSLYQDDNGILWIGTYGGGLNKFDPKTETFIHYQHDENNLNSLANDSIWKVYGDNEGIWVATEGGLDHYDPKSDRFIHYQHDKTNPDSLSIDLVTSIYEDRKGILWIGTIGGGLNQFDRNNNQFIRYQNEPSNPNSLSNNTVVGIDEDSNGALWITTENGVNKYDQGSDRFAHYYHNPLNPNGLSNNQISAIHEDKNGILWIGTKGGGLNKFDQQNGTFIHYLHDDNNPHSISNNNITAIHSDNTGALWIGMEGGRLNLFYPETETFIHYPTVPNDPNKLNGGMIWDIDVDLTGNVWIAYIGAGLDKFNPKDKTVVHYGVDENNPDSLTTNWLSVVKVDSSGLVWIGTDEVGASLFDPVNKTFTHYMPDDKNTYSLSNGVVSTIFEDNKGTIWIGTDDGLNRFNPSNQTFTIYQAKHGLAGNSVAGILEDNQGYLWISTNKGLSKFNPQTETFRNYNKHDGLQGNLFLPRSAYKSATGELFFGGINGFNAFYPDKLVDNQTIPPVFLTDFQLFNKSVSIGKDSPLQKQINFAEKITLSYKQSVFSFEFAALNYRAYAKNQYAYMMEGFDKEWTYVDSHRRFATYTNLDTGEYTFRVKASNNDGLWNETGTSIQVIILPPWWQTWWAYTLYALAILGSILTFFIIQQRKLKYTRVFNERLQKLNERLQEADKFKDEFLANTSHELRTPLHGIIGIAESLIDGATGELSDKTKANLTMIMGSSKRLANLVNEILDFSKLRHQELELQLKPIGLREIVEIVITLSQPSVRNKHVQLINAISPDCPPANADENRLQQILHNLLGNAIKFTEKGKIEVSTKVVNQHFEVIISDTGIGIEENKFSRIFESFEQAEGSIARKYGGTGLGLAMTKQLVQLHGGEIWVKSQIGVGSQFIFTLPVAKSLAKPLHSDNAKELSLLKEPVELIIPVQNEGSFTILIVDDEPVNIQVLINHLSSLHNYNIIQASSGIEACRLIEEGAKPDLVLLDVMMPRMTGYEAAKEIRKRFSANELPILMLTAKNQVSDLTTGLEAGANDYLTKPISKDELLARVKTHLKLHDLNRAYSRFVPHEFLQFLNKESIVDIQLGDQVEKEMTILFSDIRDFTSISEKMTPQDNFDYLNAYLGQMEPIIHQYQGFIDKYIGDAIMALFPTSVDNAIKGAIAMLKTLAKYNKILQYTEFDTIRIGIGLHTGKLMLGTVGGQKRMDSTVISDAVNLASRIEGLTKTYHTPLLITENTYQQLTDPSQYKIRIIDRVTVKGKTEPVTIYEVFDAQESVQVELKSTTLADFEQGFHYFHDGEFEPAQKAFEKVLQVNSDDKAAQIYVESCRKVLGIIMPKQPVILVVDDVPINIKFLLNILKEHHFEVLIAKDGETALKVVERRKPHLILLDIMMPGINGFEVCQRLKENTKTQDIPVVFMTTLSEINDKIKGFQLGAVDYVTKPFQEEEVLSRIRTHLKLSFLQQQAQERNVELETQNQQLKDKINLATQIAL
jgi:signal transduction histidine kinase/DNA-binding response OmpR family regulator/streptogramin lyase